MGFRLPAAVLFAICISRIVLAAAPQPGVSLTPGVSEALQRLNQDYSSGRLAQRMQALKAQAEGAKGVAGRALGNSVKLPVILGKFTDLNERFDNASFNTLLFGANPTGNMIDFYKENSRDKFTVSGDVKGWFALSQNQAYYVADGNKGLSGGGGRFVRDLAAAADATVDFSQYDSDGDGYVDVVCIVHTGGDGAAGATNSIWSHSSSISRENTKYPNVVSGSAYVTNDPWPGHEGQFMKVDEYIIQPELAKKGEAADGQIQIGVFCHEFGHTLGMPDLYDTTPKDAVDSLGVGNWCLMGYGTYGGDGAHPERPAHFSAYCKTKLGWVTPVVVNRNLIGQQIKQSETDGPIFKVRSPKSNKEYFLIENRQKVGFDEYLPGSGLAIWHIDERKTGNTDVTHKLVDLEEADALAQLDSKANYGDAGDLFPGTAIKRAFDEESTPNSLDNLLNSMNIAIRNISDSQETMTADFINGSISVSGPAFGQVGERVTFTVTVANEFNFSIEAAHIQCEVPSGSAFVSASNSGRLANNQVIWDIATIASKTQTTVSFDVTPNRAGLLTISHCALRQVDEWTLIIKTPAVTQVTGTALIRDIGALHGRYSSAVGINIGGQVAANTTGFCVQPDESENYYAWPGRFDGYGLGESIEALIGQYSGGWYGRYSYATGINDAGVVCGFSEMNYNYTLDPTFDPEVDPYGGNPWRAFKWSGGQATQLQSFYQPDKGWSFCWATAINNSGTVVGYGPTSEAKHFRGARWDGVTPSQLNTLMGDDSRAYAINDAGQAVGSSSYTEDSVGAHAVLWNGSTPQDIHQNGSYSVAYGINNLGHVVGLRDGKAFLWTAAEGMIDLDIGVNSGGASAINDNDIIVGGAVIWHNRWPIALPRIVPASSQWTELSAGSINNNNHIAGQGKHFGSNTVHGFVLELPPDAPPTIANPKAVIQAFPNVTPVSFPGTGGLAQFKCDVADDRALRKVEAIITHPDNSVERVNMPTYTASANQDSPQINYTVPENNTGFEQVISVVFEVTDTGFQTAQSLPVTFFVRAKHAFLSTPDYSPNPAIRGQLTTFTAATNEPSATFRWNFGDGSAERTGNPVGKVFSVTGSYNVSVSAKSNSSAGSQSVSMNFTVTVVEPGQSISFTTTPNYSPNPGTAGQAVIFTCEVSDAGASVKWKFSDGAAEFSGKTVTHIFAQEGTYTAIATATKVAQTTSFTINNVQINPGSGGNASDSDGDGFPDNVEAAFGSSSSDENDTPFGGAGPGTPVSLEVSKSAVKLVFNKPKSDSITMSGVLPVPANFTSAGKKVVVVVGGLAQGFMLTEKSTAVNEAGSLKLGVKAKKGVVSAQSSKLDVKLLKGDFVEELAAAGLTNANAVKKPVSVPMAVYFNNTVFEQAKAMLYTAKAGKSGAAK